MMFCTKDEGKKMKNRTVLLFLVYFLPIPIVLLSLCIGPSDLLQFKSSLLLLIDFLTFSLPENEKSSMLTTILFDVRLPRVLLAFLAGGVLSVSGSALQAIFRNPLVSPYVLGLSSGAAFGAALALAWPFIPVQLSAFVFGLLAVLISYLAAVRQKQISVVSLILAGVIVGGIFTALLTIVQFLSDPFKLQTIVSWTMGNLHNAGWKSVYSIIIPIAISLFVILLMRWKLNVLALGDEEARTSGINPQRNKIIILIAATLASSAVVSVVGIIGLFGLIVPHMVRMMVGPDNRVAIPVNFFFGGMFLLIIDDFSRTMASFEIPIGIFTMLIGAPFFLYLMKKTKTGWE